MQPLRTYLVEDSPVIRDNLISTLEELLPLVVVGTAEDEASALQWLGQPDHPVDLVILDIFLKQGSGLGVLLGVQRLALTCKWVVLSNYATHEMRRKCLELGADRVFDKSHEIEALLNYCEGLALGDPADTVPLALP